MSMSSSSAGGPVCNDGRPNGVNNSGLGLGGGMTTCSTAAARAPLQTRAATGAWSLQSADSVQTLCSLAQAHSVKVTMS